MQRRLPAEGTVATRFILAFVILLLPWLVDAQQQQNRAQGLRQGFESPRDGSGTESISRLEATRLSERAIPIETPIAQRGTDVKKKHKRNSHDESAIATFDAPADSAVRAHPARRSGIVDSTSLSPQSARSLEDWEVEDFILLATVDGKLHARDRRTGKERWALELEQPMLETIYHKKNRSSLDENANPVDDYLWVVEPSRDGSLYVYVPTGSHPGLMNTGLTIKKLVEEMTPYADEKPAVVYTGEKKTTLITLDAETGTIIRWFGTKGSIVNKDSSCSRPDGIVDPEGDECSTKGTLTLGRTEYTVGIQAKDGHEIATIKYTEWGPNLFDQDLLRQHRNTLDGKYLYSSHDGSIFAYDFSQADRHSQLYKQKFSSPVVRVFDIARPWGTEHKTPDLIALPQPVPPIVDESLESIRNNRIFLNHTEDGSWYAMSGNSYPLVIDGPERAQCDNVEWWQQAPLWESMNEDQVSKVLVGLHSIDKHEPAHKHLLTIGGPAPMGSEAEPDLNNSLSITSAPTMLHDFVNNFSSQLIILGLVVLVIISNTHRVNRLFMRNLSLALGWKTSEIHSESESSKSMELSPENLSDRELSLPENTTAEKVPKDDNTTVAEPIWETKAEGISLQPPDVNIVGPVKPDEDNTPEIDEDPDATPKKKKKAHRGKRGGRMHNKNKGTKKDSDDSPPNGQNSSDNLDSTTSLPRPPATVEDAIRDAQNLGNVPRTIEPDIVTVDNNVDDISDSIVRIDKMVFDQNKIVGTGSNGTTVFKGEWDGRTVAIKRLLIQFFDLASQETKLLRESDDHPNVIRYYAQTQRAGFLYIALELCPASLAEVISSPHLHRELAQAGERDLPNVLCQITNGVAHLHALRIVHRDLKPQNILVNIDKKTGKPRLMVSDFGLCKKLDNEQSSFRATTAHAAGTTGWRAPELLLDDDARESSKTTVMASTNSTQGSSIIGNEESTSTRRATRAIDIFSLGIVFFYVLTGGQHPFDCGDKYMREVNIRKNHYSLSALEVLGDYAYEAKDLISMMIHNNPKMRPTAQVVLAHPFFWSPKKRLNFLCDVSDHFEKEKRDPPSWELSSLEELALEVTRGDFLRPLGREFVDSLGKQRKYTGTRMLDLLRALRNKKNHYEDMSDKLKRDVGPLPEGYLSFWTRRFPNLLISCWRCVAEIEWDQTDRFHEYYEPANT